MTIESQLERICVALEALARMHAGPIFNKPDVEKKKPEDLVDALKKNDEKRVETKKAEAKTEPKTEVKKEEAKPEPETTNKTSFDDLADKVKALGRMNRDAVVTLFKQFGIERLGGLEEKDYITFDVAIAKALNKTNKANEA